MRKRGVADDRSRSSHDRGGRGRLRRPRPAPHPAHIAPALFPAEERAIAHAGAKRRHEFTATRHCAHRALPRLGLPPRHRSPGTSAPETQRPETQNSLVPRVETRGTRLFQNLF
ncbi:hypothetical protein ACFW0T_11545, partial [Streptomyces sp. NPDC058989]